MTDKEIVNSLKAWLHEMHNGYQIHLECGGKQDIKHEEYINLISGAINLIESQQERMNKINRKLNNRLSWMKDCATPLNNGSLPYKIQELERVIEIVKGVQNDR
jgi:hypothetical protein